MAHRGTGWRSEVRRYLTERLDQPIQLADLLAACLPLVPLHAATRAWMSKHKRMALDKPTEMRRTCLISELGGYPAITWDPPLRKGMRTGIDTVLVAVSSTCVTCGAPFLAGRRSVACSHLCGARHAAKQRWKKPEAPRQAA